MKQEALDPVILQELVKKLTYKPDWSIYLEDVDRGQGSVGLTLCILTNTQDSDAPVGKSQWTQVLHYMPVPPAAYNEESWRRWLLEQLLLVESHECCEFFRINGVRSFAPNHGPGADPYIVRQLSTLEAAETTFRGEHREQSVIS